MIYISGPMTGLPDHNRQAFNNAEKELHSKGYSVFNPAKIKIDEGEWADYMREDICALVRANSIVMLNGWHVSKGATLEHRIATDLGLKVYERLEDVPSHV